MQAVHGKVGSQSVKVYACHKHRTEGNSVCANTLRRPVADVDAAVTDWISANVLREELVVETLHEIRRRLAERARATNAEIPRLEERAATLRQELQKLGEALVATDEKPHTIVRLIADREKALHDVEARLAALIAAPGAINLETRRLEKEARRRLTELRGLLGRNPEEARTALEALLAGPLSCAPIETPEGKRYAITGKIAVGSLFTIESVPRGIRTVRRRRTGRRFAWKYGGWREALPSSPARCPRRPRERVRISAIRYLAMSLASRGYPTVWAKSTRCVSRKSSFV
jgi:hypothetical protein